MTDISQSEKYQKMVKEAVRGIEDNLDNEEGTITFVLREIDLQTNPDESVFLGNFSSDSGETALRLYRTPDIDIVYEFLRPGWGLRRCQIDVSDWDEHTEFFFAMTWESGEIGLHIGPKGGSEADLRESTSSKVESKVRLDKPGRLVVIGSEGVDVGYYHIQENHKETLRPTAEEIFEFTLGKVDTLLNTADEMEFYVESTLVQQAIIMLVTGMETYLEERFVELAAETSSQEVLQALADSSNMEASNLRTKAKNAGLSPGEMVRDQKYNFQNISEASQLYSNAFDIDLEGVINRTGDRGPIERNIQYRHRIIHEAVDLSMLNIDKVPKQDPELANTETGRKTRDSFDEVISAVMEETEEYLQSG